MFIIKSVLFALFVFQSCDGEVSDFSKGRAYLYRSADRFIRNFLAHNDQAEQTIDSFTGMIEDLVSRADLSDKAYRNIARDIDDLEYSESEGRDSLFFRLAVQVMRTPKTDVLLNEGLFESEERQDLFSTLLDLAERVGAQRSEVLACFSRGSYDLPDPELETRLTVGDVSGKRRLFECGTGVDHPMTRTLLVGRLFGILAKDMPQALHYLGVAQYVERNERVLQKMMDLEIVLDPGSVQQTVWEGLLESALAILSVSSAPSDIAIDMTKIASQFYISMDQFHVLIEDSRPQEAKENMFRSLLGRVRAMYAELTRISSGSTLIDFKRNILHQINVSFETNPDAQVFLLEDLTGLVDRYLAYLGRWIIVYSAEEVEKILDTLQKVIDFGIFVFNSDYSVFSRVALREWIKSIPVTPEGLKSFVFSQPNIALMDFAYKFALHFNRQIVTAEIFPHWSPERIDAVAFFITAKCFNGKDHKSHAEILALVNERTLLQAKLVFSQMATLGISGLKIGSLIHPVDWAMDFMRSPKSIFSKWVAQQITDTSKLPDRYTYLSGVVEHLCRRFIQSSDGTRVSVERCSPKAKWALNLPEKVMRMDVETESTIFASYASLLLELLQIRFSYHLSGALLIEADQMLTHFSNEFELQFNVFSMMKDLRMNSQDMTHHPSHLKEVIVELEAAIAWIRTQAGL